MRLINWNVNGLRARYDLILEIIQKYSPDVMTIQESKINSMDFEWYREQFEVYGFKSYLSYHDSGFHGVLTLVNSSYESSATVVESGRVIDTRVDGTRIINVYINQGQEVDSDEFFNKLTLMEKLKKYLADIVQDSRVYVAGDFNICPTENDVWSTDHWTEDTVSCTPTERRSFSEILESCGLINLPTSDSVPFTWYGYRTAYRKYDGNILVDESGKYGIKCDHILSTANTGKVKLLIDYRLPKIKTEVTTSDHVPMILDI